MWPHDFDHVPQRLHEWALANLKEQAGVASGLYSAAQFGLSAAIAGLLFTLFDSTDLHVVALASLACLVIPWALLLFSSTVKTGHSS